MGKKAGSQPVVPKLELCEDRETQGSKVTHLELGLLPWVRDSASVQPATSSPLYSFPTLRAVSTGDLMMVSWTPITLATSLKASAAFLTMWTQPWPSQLTDTVAGSVSTSSRVLGVKGE